LKGQQFGPELHELNPQQRQGKTGKEEKRLENPTQQSRGKKPDLPTHKSRSQAATAHAWPICSPSLSAHQTKRKRKH